ncbi:MAG: hypothetical protein ACOC0N_12060 [Chroococcales cyanobacterium]
MLAFLILLIAIAPWILSGILAFSYSQSFWALLWVLIGAIAGAVFIPLSGIYWLQTLHRRFLESQAIGMIFVPVILPFFAYSGSVAGAWLVTSFYSPIPLSWAFIVISVGLVVVLGGLLIPAIATIPSASANPSTSISLQSSQFIIIPILAIANGILSAWLSYSLAHLILNFL